jgi:hypothetical protein
MMGERQVEQELLFYGFSIERHVPADHLLRSIDRFVDLAAIRAHLQPYYSHTGLPSIDPELFADYWLHAWHSFRTAAMRGSPSQPGLSLVL